MIKNLNSNETMQQRFLHICKPLLGLDNKPEIDFLLVDKEIQQFQQLQLKICQQIVEFVDEHRQKFINVNQKFLSIEQNIDQSELLIKKLLPRVDMYKNTLYSPQSKIQELVTNYEKGLIQQKLCEMCEEQSEFLVDFVQQFQEFVNINVEKLSERHKYFIVHLLKKKEYIKFIYEHPLIKTAVRETMSVLNVLDNINEQLQFYLSEQLARIAVNGELRNLVVGEITVIEEMKIWYEYGGRVQGYYEIVEEAIVGRELNVLENFLVTHKQNLIAGKEEQAVKQFFNNLFKLIQQFPMNYPRQRILRIIYKFLGKKQLNFMYSYVVPAFPISYSAYKCALSCITNEDVRAQLQAKHGWNLKFWAQLRIKSIMDRSSKQRQNNVNKWIEIVFKKSFMIEGVKYLMIHLAFLLVNRYCNRVQEVIQYTSISLNQTYNQLHLVNQTLKAKLEEGFVEELSGKDESKVKSIKEELSKVVNNIYSQMESTLKKWVLINMEMVINTCKSSLQGYKQLVMKIISKKDKQKAAYNIQQNILKPLHAYFVNNPSISDECQKFVQETILLEIQKYYDAQYAKQIYNYCNSNVSTQQMKSVMEIVASQRQSLFQLNQSNDK